MNMNVSRIYNENGMPCVCLFIAFCVMQSHEIWIRACAVNTCHSVYVFYDEFDTITTRFISGSQYQLATQCIVVWFLTA